MDHSLVQLNGTMSHAMRATQHELVMVEGSDKTWSTGEEVKWSEVAQSCPTPCDPVDCSPPGFSVHGSLQVRILEWVAISFSRGSSRPRDQTWVSCIAGGFFTIWTTRETPFYSYWSLNSGYSFPHSPFTLFLLLFSPILSSISSPILLSHKIKEK